MAYHYTAIYTARLEDNDFDRLCIINNDNVFSEELLKMIDHVPGLAKVNGNEFDAFPDTITVTEPPDSN